MNKTENYLGIAKHDILMANNSEELKSYVASVLCEIDELQQENNKLKMINKEYERLNKENHRGFKIIDVQEYDSYELLSYKIYKDNWNKLKEYIISTRYEYGDLDQDLEDYDLTIEDVLDKMQELEQGNNKSKNVNSDSLINEKLYNELFPIGTIKPFFIEEPKFKYGEWEKIDCDGLAYFFKRIK